MTSCWPHMILGQNQKKQNRNNRRWDELPFQFPAVVIKPEVRFLSAYIQQNLNDSSSILTFAKIKLLVNSVFLFLYVCYNSQYAFPIGGKAAPLEAQEELSISPADFPRQLSIHI